MLDHQTNESSRENMGEVPVQDRMQEGRLRWYCHVLRTAPDSMASCAYELEVEDRRHNCAYFVSGAT